MPKKHKDAVRVQDECAGAIGSAKRGEHDAVIVLRPDAVSGAVKTSSGTAPGTCPETGPRDRR